MKAKRATFVALGIGGLVVGVSLLAVTEGLRSITIGRMRTSGEERTLAAIGYVLSEDRWTTFRIPPGALTVKILTNASVPREYERSTEYAARYAIRYEVLEGKRVKQQGAYVFRSRLDAFPGASGGPWVLAKYYLDPEIVPLGTRSTVLRVGSSRAGRRLKLRAAWAELGVRDVVCRVLVQDAPSSYKVQQRWARLPRDTRIWLARGSIYGADFLTEEERRNLLDNRWRPVGPEGVSGRDFYQRRLYSVLRDETASSGAGSASAGLCVDAEMLATIPLPEGGGCVRLEFDRNSAAPGSVVISWFGREPGKRRDIAVELPESRGSWIDDFGDGFLVLWSHEGFCVRAFLEGGDSALEITPVPECVGAFLAAPGKSVHFAKGGLAEASSPLRIDARRILTPGGALEEGASLEYEVLDWEGGAIARGEIELENEISLYDAALGAPEKIVTEPARRYFLLGPECSGIRLRSASEGVLVTGYTRPEGVLCEKRVPEEYFKFEELGDEYRDWFFVRPTDYLECLRSGREVLLSLQKRPPVVREELWRGEFEVRTYETGGPARAFRVLEKEVPTWSPKNRRPGLAELRPGEPARIEFWGLPGDETVTPRAILFADSSTPVRVKFLVDGRALFERRAISSEEEFVLPPVSPGSHLVEVQSDGPAVVYIESRAGANSPEPISGAKRTLHFDRLVYALDGEGLWFEVPKSSWELVRLTIRPYQLLDDPRERMEIRAVVEGIRRVPHEPLRTWTFAGTRFSVRAAAGETLRLLGSGGQAVVACPPFFLDLGEDLAPGTYRVRLWSEDGRLCCVRVAEVRATKASASAAKGSPAAASGESARQR